MHEMITIDLGPDFHGLRGEIAGKIVCVATPQVEHDPQEREIVRRLIKRQGGDCPSCRNCLIGQHD